MSDLSGLSDQQLMALAQSQGGLVPPPPVQVQALPPVPGQNSSGNSNVAPGYDAGFDLSHFTPSQLLAMQADANPGMSAPEDVLRSTGAGLERGDTSLLTAPADMGAIGEKALDGISHFAQRHGLNMPDSGQLASITPPSIGTYLDAASIALAKRMHLNPTAAQMGVGAFNPLAASSGPRREEGAVALNSGMPLHTPQTLGGNVAERLSEFGPGALTPGGPLRSAGRVVLPAAGSWVGQTFAPDGYKDWGGLLGAALGGGMQGAAEGVVDAPKKLMADALASATPADLAAASRVQSSAAALPGGGIHVTAPEAVGTPSMLGLQHFVENSPVGKPLVEGIFAKRPGQIRSTTEALADAIHPADTSPSSSALANQQGAQGVLDTERQAINAQAKPHYDALPGQVLPPNPVDYSPSATYAGGPQNVIPHDQYATLANNTAYQDALSQVRGDNLLNAGIAHLPDNDLGVVNEVVKQLDRNVAAHQQTATNPTGNNQKAGLYQSARTQADALAASVSPDWRAARDIVSQGHTLMLDPLGNGPVGAIAAAPKGPGQLPAQTAALYPPKPPEGYSNDAAEAVQLLPEHVTGNLTRHYVMDALNDVGRDRTNGQPTMNFGGTLASQLVGHPERAAIFDNALSSLDPSGGLQSHAQDLISALQATGRRLAPGSGTEFNRQMQGKLATAPAPIRTLGALLDPLEIGKNIDHAVGGALYKRNVQSIARILEMSPQDAGAALQNYKATGGTNPLVNALLMSGGKAADKP